MDIIEAKKIYTDVMDYAKRTGETPIDAYVMGSVEAFVEGDVGEYLQGVLDGIVPQMYDLFNTMDDEGVSFYDFMDKAAQRHGMSSSTMLYVVTQLEPLEIEKAEVYSIIQDYIVGWETIKELNGVG